MRVNNAFVCMLNSDKSVEISGEDRQTIQNGYLIVAYGVLGAEVYGYRHHTRGMFRPCQASVSRALQFGSNQ